MQEYLPKNLWIRANKFAVPLRQIENFFTFIFIFALVLTAILFFFGKGEVVPQFWVSILAACLSYLACNYTREKLRLDLLDRRFELYERVLDFCSHVTFEGGLTRSAQDKEAVIKAINAAHSSFRGIGYHKTRALFGDEVWQIFDKLNASYSYLISHQDVSPTHPKHDQIIEKEYEHLSFILEMATKLPNIFKPYVYFGDYKKQ